MESEITRWARTRSKEDMSDNMKYYGFASLLRSLTQQSHGNSVSCGWYSDVHTGEPLQRNVPEMIALMHSELSEALEAYRKNLMDDHLPERKGIEVELADLLHRVFDLAGYLGLDLGGAYVEKGLYNLRRHDHTPEARAQANGKAF